MPKITPFLWFDNQAECGWLKDKYALSWQIVPRVFSPLLADENPQKSKRVMDTMLKMSKIDIAVLRRAYEG